jgi:hypothetical protein
MSVYSFLNFFGVTIFRNYFRVRDETDNETYKVHKEDFLQRGSCLTLVC